MKITFIAPAHDETEETHLEGEAEVVNGRITADETVVDFASFNPALPGRVDLSKLAGEDAELWMRGIATMTGGTGLVPIPSSDLSTEELSKEEIARLKSLVGGTTTEVVEKRAYNLPNRLTR